MTKIKKQLPKSDSDEPLLGFPGLFLDKSVILTCAECDFTFTLHKASSYDQQVEEEDEDKDWEGVCPHCGSSYLV